MEGAGYSVPVLRAGGVPRAWRGDFARPILIFLGIFFGVVLFVAVVGEWLGPFGALTERVPWPIGVLIGGYPVFRAGCCRIWGSWPNSSRLLRQKAGS